MAEEMWTYAMEKMSYPAGWIILYNSRSFL